MNIRLGAIGLVSLVLVVGCKGCGDSSSGEDNLRSLPPGCSDIDADGFERGADCEVSLDCDDGDAAVNPDAIEECDGVDNNCDGTVDEGCEETCTPGDSRICSSDVGACSEGTQLCMGGTWGDCSGQEPVSEICDGVDNDCDGDVDETGDELCDDGMACNGTETCDDGACTTTGALDCSDLSGPCTIGMCSEKDGGCKAFPAENGSTCDDGNFCTNDGVCSQGVCETTPTDCSGEDDACNVGVCDEVADACVKQPMSDGTTCDDGIYCTTGDLCTAGVCDGAALDCSSAADQCNAGVCDEATDSCVPSPLADGSACDDAMYCNTGEACQAGVCVGGGARDCSASGGSCRTGTCNEATDSCDGPPVADGTPCDDSAYCTTNDSCLAGACVGGAPLDCSSADAVCRVGTCNEALNQCVPAAAADGTACDDGLFCTVNTTCTTGACTGAPFDCSSATGGDVCLMATCSEVAGMCETSVAMPVPPTCCNPAVDADLDGFDECNDCDDSNGAAYPGAPEFCNGFDDDCDMMIDEDFDVDMDGYSVCSTDPAVFDCDDNVGGVNPGAMELCGPGNIGNGVDEDCDGYIDEVCDCNPTIDSDNDGVSQCGDCDDTDNEVYPGATELCDGKDNDCNTFTTPNCGVSGECNHDGDNDYSNDPDLCRSDMICACQVNNSGNCTGNYFCTSFCNTSETGPQGDGCTATQSCQYDLLRSGSVHGCGEQSDPPGASMAGASCSRDSDCRSLSCVNVSIAGPPQRICLDYCNSDAYCSTPGVSCLLRSGQDGQCYPEDHVLLGGGSGDPVGTTCTRDFDCDHGHCADAPDATRYCTEACCSDADCGTGYTCSLRGTSTDTNFVVPAAGTTCTTAADCAPNDGDVCFDDDSDGATPSVCAWRLVETGTMCIKDDPGQGVRVAGQSCTVNGDCGSNFCELDLGVCIDVCCSDDSCQPGLGCEFVTVETTDDRVTSARVCLNLSTEGIIRRR